MNIETKMAIVDARGRARSKAEVAIAKERIALAKQAFDTAMADIEAAFDLECWNGFSSECTSAELNEMATNLNRK